MIGAIVIALFWALVAAGSAGYCFLWYLYPSATLTIRREIQTYHGLLAIWILAYFLPQLAMNHTDWYGNWFHPLQACIPLLLIYAVFNLTTAWWREYLGYVLILQIFHNLGDVIFDDAWQIYDYRQGILNAMELCILVGCGLPTLLITTYLAHRTAGGLDNRGTHSDSRVAAGRSGLSRHV